MSDCNHDVKQKMCQMGKCKPTPGALTREQVHELADRIAEGQVEGYINQWLDHDAALRATLAAQQDTLDERTTEIVCLRKQCEHAEQEAGRLREVLDEFFHDGYDRNQCDKALRGA